MKEIIFVHLTHHIRAVTSTLETHCTLSVTVQGTVRICTRYLWYVSASNVM
jgi:hypothetical protein